MTKAELESLNLDLIALLTSVRDKIDDTLEGFGANDDECEDDILDNDSED